MEKGTYLEAVLYDERHGGQGKGLWRINGSEQKTKDGVWLSAKLIAVSDAHLYGWLTEGPGEAMKRNFRLHLCITPEKDCPKCKRRRMWSSTLMTFVPWMLGTWLIPKWAGSSRPQPKMMSRSRWRNSQATPRGAHVDDTITGAKALPMIEPLQRCAAGFPFANGGRDKVNFLEFSIVRILLQKRSHITRKITYQAVQRKSTPALAACH